MVVRGAAELARFRSVPYCWWYAKDVVLVAVVSGLAMRMRCGEDGGAVVVECVLAVVLWWSCDGGEKTMVVAPLLVQ